jgi:hypothetical protein
MNQQFVSIQAARLSAEPLEIQPSILPNLRAALPDPSASPALRGGSAIPFAVRNGLRSSPVLSGLAVLQKCAGMALVACAWLVFLWGMAHLVLAALHNQQGELGLGLASTLAGAKSCTAGFLLAAVGVPQWVMGDRKIRQAI